ncbi:MAG: 4Fe-4S binding protein [Rhodoferax sp.]|nr:4Fe-4S binding protein [Rhodoferax sp.]MBP8135211.1 4Fe-4S binding protein [Rhodoferax sp.]
MLKSISVRKSQGTQYIADLRAAQPAGFRSKPLIADTDCKIGCQECISACPSSAILVAPVQIDLGRCVLCGDCAPVCPSNKISFSNDVRLAATNRQALIVTNAHPNIDPIKVSNELRKRFGRSLKLRSVSAGGCNGCELEINALGNVNFDLGRYGIDIVASPRHADAMVISGPITRNMVEALEICWDAMPEPKLVIAVGACAISGGVFANSNTLDRRFLEKVQPSLYVPGCPAHPLTFITGIMDLLGIDTR